MTQQKLTDAIASSDIETKMWKSEFAAAKAAYDIADFKQCETLLARALEQGKGLKDKKFAVNTCLVGQGALLLATGDLDAAEKHLDQAIQALSGSTEAALKELYAVALRFRAQVLSERGDIAAAMEHLEKASDILGTIGLDGAVQLAYVMSDLAILSIKQEDLQNAGELVLAAMDLLQSTLGSENPEYIRANVLYSLCHSENEEEFLGGVEDSLVKMEYQLAAKHPDLVRAIRWYLHKLDEIGDKERIALVKDKFASSLS